MDKFNCQIPILYHGRHLDNIIPPDLTNCSDEITKEAFDLIQRKQSKCTRSQACETKRFALSYLTEKTWLENKTLAYFQYKYPEVTHSNTYISYDIISWWTCWIDFRCINFGIFNAEMYFIFRI
jgi:hypothetical protein